MRYTPQDQTICLSSKKGRAICNLVTDDKVINTIHIFDKEAEKSRQDFENSFFDDSIGSFSEFDPDSERGSDVSFDIHDVEHLFTNFIKHYKYKEDGLLKLQRLLSHLKTGKKPSENDLKEMFDQVQQTVDGCIGREIILNVEGSSKMVPIPDDNVRSVIYVFGPSGAGKSTFSAAYAIEYLKKFPNNKVWLISRKDYDPIFDHNKKLMDENGQSKVQRIRLPIDPNEQAQLLAHPEIFHYKNFANTLVIFDDVDTFEPALKRFIGRVRDDLLEVGRADNVSVISMSHAAAKNAETKTSINESQAFVFFPNGGSVKGIEYILTEYVGLSKEQIRKIYSLPSRWVMLYKTFPLACIYNKGVYLI